MQRLLLALLLIAGCKSSLSDRELPKVELHLHLDCSLSYDVVKKIRPSIRREEYEKEFIAPAKCRDLADYISRAVRGVELMQTREQLQWVTLDLMRQLKKDHVIYAEIRFAPLLHTQQGLSATEVVQAVTEALEQGVKETGVEANLILCTLRHFTEEQSMETVRLVEAFRDQRVTGFDIAADEARYPITSHIRAFAYAQEKGLNRTAHAGEARGPESVRETLQFFKPSRIGHGVRSMEDPQLIAKLKQENIHLEVCPTSNVQTNVVDSIQHHAVSRLFHQGVSLGINTDARTISNVTLADEYRTLQDVFSWSRLNLLRCNLEAINHAFTTEEVKQRIRTQLMTSYE